MSLIDRFTRDAASKYVWAVMSLAAIAGLAYAIVGGGAALDDARAASQDRAVRYVNEVLLPRLPDPDPVAPIIGQAGASLKTAVERSVLADERVARVRIWSSDGTLLFSTDGADTLGSNAGLNDEVLLRASRDGVVTRSDISDTGGQDDPERSLLRTYAPLGTDAVAEIDQTDEGTLAPVRSEWFRYELLAGVFLLVLLVMTGLSLRDPIEPINAGVPFAVSSIPAGFSLIDDDRLHAVHEVYRLAAERVGRLQQKLRESEEARRRLEGDMQRILSKAATSSRPVVLAPATPPAKVVAEPAIVQVPESDVVDAPVGDAWSAAPAGPLARASRDQKTLPSTTRQPKPPVEKPKRTPRRPKGKREKPEAPAAREAAVQPSPTPAPQPREAAVPPSLAPEPEPTPEPRVAAMAAAPTPARTTTPTSVDPEVDDAKAHEAALETFIRLTESDRQPHDTTEVDQGAVRAALARTAARKKPGGERFQSHEGGQPEGSGGGRPRSR